jgi:exosortase
MLAKLVAPTRTWLRSPEGAAITGALVALLWVFWPTLVSLAQKWESDPQYSHGYLVPLFALFLLWSRREQIVPASLQPSWWGLPLIGLGLGMRFAGTFFYHDWLSALALLPAVAGLCVLAGGWAALRWSWPAVAFLVFMLPLPYRLEVGLAHPLQRIATVASTFALQTLGFTAFADGNVIRLGQVRIGVVEACSGLSMLVIFFALSTAVALVVKRPWPDRLLIWLSAVPIALAANITRITVTGVLHKVAGPKLADLVFHDLAGWLMMPYALGLLWVELRLLDWLLVPQTPRDEPSVGLGRPGAAPAGPKESRKEKRKTAKPTIAIPGLRTLRK